MSNVNRSHCYFNDENKYKEFCELTEYIADMILTMTHKEKIGEISWLLQKTYDNYVAAETDDDPITTLKEEWNIPDEKKRKP